MPHMCALKLVLWAFLVILGSVAFAYVVGVVNPNEKVNGLWLVVAAACMYVLAFRFYGRWLARSVTELNDQRVTPAVRLNDGVNFHPTNKYVLFGHHFAAIAGAGPLLGPVLAALAGLGFAVVNALYLNAWGTFTIAMTIPIGFIMGFYLQRFRPGQVAEVSLLGVVLLIAAVIFGRVVAQSSIAEWFELERTTLVWGLAGYGFLASVLPGWMLLV